MKTFTIGHGRRPSEELLATISAAGVRTLVDVRRFPASRWNPQFNRSTLAASLDEAGIAYRHVEELGGRRSGEPGEERFGCLRPAAFASYAALMTSAAWQAALADALSHPTPVCFLCAETCWQDCHRRLIAEQLAARGIEVVHLVRPGASEPHARGTEAEWRNGTLYLCGEPVA
jgi:uncharacterized protein (DUF488 family)